jgi:mannose-6-phosphate isomerase-like protein (cupin superfamily)
MISGKIWGKTEVLLRTPMIEIHRLTINPNSRCSLHKHQFKWNAFYVATGFLMIETHKLDYELIDVTTLYPGDLMTVKPNEFHRFAPVISK